MPLVRSRVPNSVPPNLAGDGTGAEKGPNFGGDPTRAVPIAAVPNHHHMVYHMVMGRREVLVQLDDDLVERLDRLAEQEGTSRSELLRRGAAAVLQAAEDAEADRALREAYRKLPQDPAIVSVAARLATATAPEW